MSSLQPPYRAARAEDAMAMAELVDMAGEGLPYYLWAGMALPGQSPWEVGQERARRETGSFSYRNAVVREDAGTVASCLVGYGLADHPEPTDLDAMPPMFVPLQQLEDLVPGTWYVNVLATYPAYRRKGYGRDLLHLAETIAHDAGKHGMSIIVADSNTVARNLYEHVGYREHARRPMVKETWQNPGANWVLLTKKV